jgi:hypothetical protein
MTKQCAQSKGPALWPKSPAPSAGRLRSVRVATELGVGVIGATGGAVAQDASLQTNNPIAGSMSFNLQNAYISNLSARMKTPTSWPMRRPC